MTIDLPKRRNLFAKMVAHEVFGHPCGDKSLDMLRAEIIRLMTEEANATLSAPTDGRLDCFVKKASIYAVDSVRQAPRLQVCEKGDAALADFSEVACAISCRKCAAQAKNRICDGSANDDMTVAQGGHCVLTFRSILESAIAAATTWYGKHSPEFAKLARKPDVTWSLRHCMAVPGRSTPHQIPVPVYANGETGFHDANGVFSSEVVLKIMTNAFDFNTQETLPYIALHECLCHIFQGAASRQAQRPKPDQNIDLLSEGWIDGLTVEVFRELRSGVGPLARFRDILARDGQVRAGYEMQSTRGNSARSPASLFAPYVARGSCASDGAREALCRLLGIDRGFEAFLQLSLDLNVLLAGTDDRNQLVYSLIGAGPGSHKFQDAFKDFANDRSTSNFITAIAKF
jgi:hypothetical protein